MIGIHLSDLPVYFVPVFTEFGPLQHWTVLCAAQWEIEILLGLDIIPWDKFCRTDKELVGPVFTTLSSKNRVENCIVGLSNLAECQ